MDKEGIYLKVQTKEGIIFEGRVRSLSSFNEKGRFDILPQHANFISLIHKSLFIRPEDQDKTLKIDFDTALLRVKENRIEVYIGVEGLTEYTPVVENI